MKTLVLSIAFGCLFRFALFAADTAPEAITITAPDGVKILKLEAGQPRLYDSNPLRVIEKVGANLAGWQFTSIPQRIVISYQIRVNKTGVIYAFGCGSSRKPPTPEQVLGDDASRWVPDAGAIEGKNVAVCFRRNVTAGETIVLQSFELQLAAESIAVAGTLADASPLASTASGSGSEKADAEKPPSEVLAKEGPNAIEWALAPLDRTVPGDIRQNLTLLREDLLDEAAKKPAAGAAAYKLGEQFCNDLIETLNERDQARVRAGYTAAQAKANMGEITNQALEARRSAAAPSGWRTSGAMAWPTYRREKDQREELRKAKENGAALENQRPVIEWADRVAQIRRILDALYAQYREAARRPAAK
jgi:hypothetical protein